MRQERLEYNVTMASKSERFVQEFVLVFGFLSGYWIYAGANPETEILKVLLSVITEVAPSLAPGASLISWVIPIGLTIGTIFGSYKIGGRYGLVAVGLAFIGGIAIESIGIYLVLVAIFLGWFAPSMKKTFR